ncbi:MAG: hypothetical protein ACLP8A_07440 [Methylovirgula sp.]|jgi:hypothetical protein
MLPTTILVDELPRCVVRPTDKKALDRFIRNAKSYLLADKPEGKVTYREADETENAKWYSAYGLHKAWGGDDDHFFGIPL